MVSYLLVRPEELQEGMHVLPRQGLQHGVERPDEKRGEAPSAPALPPLQHEVRVRPLYRPQGAADEHFSGADPHVGSVMPPLPFVIVATEQEKGLCNMTPRTVKKV